MSLKVLLDTSFLITLVNRTRPNHLIARQYYQLLCEHDAEVYLSTIAAAEFNVVQSISDLPLEDWVVLPFNLIHSDASAKLQRYARDNKNSIESTAKDKPVGFRDMVKDDVKLLGQATKEEIIAILTEDESTMVKIRNVFNDAGLLQVQCVLLADGFKPSVLGLGVQQDLVP